MLCSQKVYQRSDPEGAETSLCKLSVFTSKPRAGGAAKGVIMILDTGALLDFLKGNSRLVGMINDAEHEALYTTDLNVFELNKLLHAHNSTERQASLNAFLSTLHVLPLDKKAATEAAKLAGELHTNKKALNHTDCLIAGIALSNGVKKIVTSHPKQFGMIKEVQVVHY